MAEQERAKGLPRGHSSSADDAAPLSSTSSSSSAPLGSRKRGRRTKKQMTQEAALFSRKAAEISRGIATCAKRLERLATRRFFFLSLLSLFSNLFLKYK